MRIFRKLTSGLLIGSALIAVVVVTEANLERPEVYVNRFCLIEGESRTCNFQSLALCMAGMSGDESKCVRSLAKQ